MTRCGICLVLLSWGASAAVVDRVAVVIDKKIVTESEVLDELRLTELLNDQPLDVSPGARRAAAEHMVDQELIRRDMQNSSFATPTENGDALLRQFRQRRFHSIAEYRAALQQYGVTEAELKQRLVWQAAALRYTDFRFSSQLPVSASQSADRAANPGAASAIDQRMDAWLKQARSASKITFKQEAFQ